LISIDPVKLVAGLSYDAPSGRYGGQVIATHVAKKDAARAGCASCFLPPAFTILDATAYWNITDRAALRVGVFNITDEKYWWWSDVRDLTAASPVKDAFTQPGRNASVSVSYKF
jgi:hemoglobin/transferrin/lactoferrin receptor protein